MPNSCLTSRPLNGIIHTKPGKIQLELVDETGHIFFDTDPKATYVTDGAGTSVPLTVDARTLSFTVSSGNTYQLIVVHLRDVPGARGFLVENCDSQTTLGIISDQDTFAEFDFVVF